VIFITTWGVEGPIRVTYWRSAGAGAGFGTMSDPGKRRMIIFVINFPPGVCGK
jgi:hypothetical protein